MTNITISNKKTFLNKLGTGTAIALSGLAFYAGVLGINSFVDIYRYDSNAYSIREPLKSKNIDLAQRLYNSFKADHRLRLEDEIKLASEIEVAKKIYQSEQKKQQIIKRLEVALNLNNIETFNKIFEDLKTSGNYTNEEINDLEKRIYDISEDGLFRKISSEFSKESLELCQKYLNLYPNGSYKSRVLTNLFTNKLIILLDYLRTKKPPKEIAVQLIDIDLLFKKYSNEKISLNRLVNIDNIVKESNEYLNYISTIIPKEEMEDKLTIGSIVKTISAPWSDNPFISKTYVKLRDKAIPIGSTGIVTEIDKRRVIVEFDDSKSYNWEKDYYRKDNIAEYGFKELALSLLDPIQKNDFNLKIQELKENLKKYQ